MANQKNRLLVGTREGRGALTLPYRGFEPFHAQMTQKHSSVLGSLRMIAIQDTLGFVPADETARLLDFLYGALGTGGTVEFDFLDLDLLMRSYAQDKLPLAETMGAIYAQNVTVYGMAHADLLKHLRCVGFTVEIAEANPTTFRCHIRARKSVRTLRHKGVTLYLADARPFVSCGVIGIEIARALMERGVPVSIFPYANDSEARDHYPGDIAPLVIRKEELSDQDLWVHIDGPWCLRYVLEGNRTPRRWGYFYHELHKAPDELLPLMHRNLERVDFVSAFCRDGFTEHGLTLPTGVVHHGYDPTAYYPGEPRAKGGVCTFVSVATQQIRKGTQELIEAFSAEFSESEPVRLVIKDIECPWMDYKKLCTHRNIEVVQESWRTEQIGDLLRDSDCFVLPTFGEGFGIPILEAKACALPVITTRYGGHLDFCDDTDTYFLDYTMVPRTDGHEYERYDSETAFKSVWAKPNVVTLRQQMRRVFENPKERAAYGQRAHDRVKEMTWEAVLSGYVDEIVEAVA